jgi:hypothetical protein
MEQEWYIYKITNKTTNKSYIGQTKRYKFKNDKKFNYGILGRWYDHISSSKKSKTPLHSAINEYGATDFTFEEVEKIEESKADSREAYWIEKFNTRVPNGFNVMTHSRCKHRKSTEIQDAFINQAISIEQKIINKDNKPKLIYVYINLPTGKKRITFGQSRNSTFDETLKESNEFIKLFRDKNIPVVVENKHVQFENQLLEKYRIIPFNKTMTALYITKEDGVEVRICFGGKTIPYEKTIEKAKEFLCGLKFKTI